MGFISRAKNGWEIICVRVSNPYLRAAEYWNIDFIKNKMMHIRYAKISTDLHPEVCLYTFKTLKSDRMEIFGSIPRVRATGLKILIRNYLLTFTTIKKGGESISLNKAEKKLNILSIGNAM